MSRCIILCLETIIHIKIVLIIGVKQSILPLLNLMRILKASTSLVHCLSGGNTLWSLMDLNIVVIKVCRKEPPPIPEISTL